MDTTMSTSAGESPEQELPQQSQPSSPEDESDEFQVERRRRVQQYHSQVLAHADPLKATLGSINAGLMRESIELDWAISVYLAAGPLTLERVMQHASAIELQLKLTRQVDRLAQLELRPAGGHPNEDGSGPQKPR
jgi:hypothetical protein